MPRVRAADWCLLVVLSFVWGSAFLCYKLLDDAGIPPLTLVFGRVVLAALTMLLVARVRGVSLTPLRTMWPAFLVLGLLNNLVPFFLIAYGEQRIASALAAILNATTPIFTLLFAATAARERLTAAKLGGIGLGVAGVAIVVGPAALHRLDLTDLAQLACIAAALSYGAAAVFGRRVVAQGLDPITITTGQLCVSALIVIPVALVVDHPWTLPFPSAETLAAFGVIGVVSTSLAYVLYFRSIAAIGAVNASLVTLIVPVTALLLGAGVLHERVGASALGGMAVIALGLLVIDGRPLALLARRTARARV